MEEDIKILEDTLRKYCYKNCKGELDKSCKECKRLLAIENLIKGYRELEEKVEKQKYSFTDGYFKGGRNQLNVMTSKIKEFVEKNKWDLLETEYHFESTVVDADELLKFMEDK